MKMDGNIGVATEASYRELYNSLKNAGAVGDFHELFFACACLGYRKAKLVPIRKSDDRFWSRTIRPPEWACYYSMILEKNNYDFAKVADDRAVLAIIEQYANAGMDILIEEFLADYLISSSKGTDPQIDPTCSKELPKQFIHYIFDQSQ